MVVETNDNRTDRNDQNTNPSSSDGHEETRRERRRRRWGEAAPLSGPPATKGLPPLRWQSSSGIPAPLAASDSGGAGSTTPAVTGEKSLTLMKESVQARLAELKARLGQQSAASTVVSSSTTGASAVPSLAGNRTAAVEPTEQGPQKRARHFELDLDVTAPTFRSSASSNAAPSLSQEKTFSSTSIALPADSAISAVRSANPYLAHLPADTPDAPPAKAKRKWNERRAGPVQHDQPDQEVNEVLDDRLVRASKPRHRHKALQFVEPGRWTLKAERQREKAASVAQAGFLSGRKAGHSVTSVAMASIYGRSATGDDDDDGFDRDDLQLDLKPRADAHPDTKMPLTLEWWDMELLPSKLRKQVAAEESKLLQKQSKAALQKLDHSTAEAEQNDEPKSRSTEDIPSEVGAASAPSNETADPIRDLERQCFEQASLSYSKTAKLVQHIVPVKPPQADTGPPKPPVIHLTKKELKRQRKLRRQEKQRELQDLQAAGLIPAPEPRLTLQNFIQVLGDQAYLDPSQIEQKVMEQVQARQRAHLERNEASKLTKEQRAEKRARKLHEDTTKSVTVAIFFVKDMSHPYHRTKVDLNAQQNEITGGVLECKEPTVACIICEGGPKAIKRYSRLMLVRMKWTGIDDDDNDSVEDISEERVTQKFNPDNKCELVWQGLAVKRLFHGFVFQSCDSSDQARKILKAKGVEHYWDQVLQHASGRGTKFHLKLTEGGEEADENPYLDRTDDDIVMEDNE